MTEKDKRETLPEFTLPEHLRFLRDEFSDEIPVDVIHSNHPQNRFKVRRNWWAGLLADLEVGLAEGAFTDPDVQEKIRAFTDFYFHRPNFFDKPLTTPEDIAKANRIINVALGEEPPQAKVE